MDNFRGIELEMELLTTKDVCNMLRISSNTLKKWRKIGIADFPLPIKVQKHNGKTLWIKLEIEEWIKKK